MENTKYVVESILTHYFRSGDGNLESSKTVIRTIHDDFFTAMEAVRKEFELDRITKNVYLDAEDDGCIILTGDDEDESHYLFVRIMRCSVA